MKRKLKIALALVVLSLTGIIIFQCYWSINAYQVNKKRFDTQIDIAMQQALDGCKKDYFDSIRIVLVKRLSDPSVVIKFDTLREADTIHKQVGIMITTAHTGFGEPFHTTNNIIDFYRQKINHKATIPEVLTEMSFYVPSFMNSINMILEMDENMAHDDEIQAYLKAHSSIPSDSIFAHHQIVNSGVLEMPKNYRQADSLKLHNYYTAELEKIHIYSPFELSFSTIPAALSKPNSNYSQTTEYPYFYHGFTELNHNIFNHLYTSARFYNPQRAVLKSMMTVLLLSVLLVLFTIFCFYYIIKTLNQQKALGELKDDFINNMTHELKTPIATITVAIEGMQKYNVLNDPEKTQRYLETSRNELARLNELVSKVLDVAAFENKEVKLIKENINIDALVNELITAERSKTDKATTITYKNEAGIIDITADKLHFKNVLINILDNAVKYSAQPAIINITLTKSNNMAVFTIQDNGIGIPTAHLNRIFEKFYRVPTGNIHNVKGTGLGLNYVKYIAEAHGGIVTVKSEVNAGSEFIVSIPL